jgi:hypothetical protein
MAAFIDINFNITNNANRVQFTQSDSYGTNNPLFAINFIDDANALAFQTAYNTNPIVSINGSNITTSAASLNPTVLTQVFIPGANAIIPGTVTTIINATTRVFNFPILFGTAGALGSISLSNMGFNTPPPSVLSTFMTTLSSIMIITSGPNTGGFEDADGPHPFLAALTTPGTLACLLKGTKILTPAGEILIEDLKINDTVLTADNREVKIIDIYSSLASSEDNLYVIRKDTISSGVPNEDLFVSGGHLVKIHDKFYHPFHNKTNLIEKCDENKLVQFYHVELENYLTDFLVANGVEVESLGDIENPEHTNWDCSGEECKLAAIKQL